MRQDSVILFVYTRIYVYIYILLTFQIYFKDKLLQNELKRKKIFFRPFLLTFIVYYK